jgi:hypothetical protein
MELDLANLLQATGAVSLIVGAFLLSAWLGFAALGVCLVATGVLIERGS